MKRVLCFLGLVSLFALNGACYSYENVRDLFKKNEAIIYTVNIRNFAAVDNDKDGIITPELGDKIGTFLSAKDKIRELSVDGINVIYVMPITKVGKLKALGTAGSLYAMDSFTEIDPKLDDKNNEMSVYDEAKEFIKEAHKYNINVILDLASCGSYDLSLNKPDWFLVDSEDESVVPADWTDVRLFKIQNEDKTLYDETLKNFKSFIDLAQNLGFDGIRADVAAIKPPEFWSEIINYARKENKDFFFLAEASPDWSNPAPKGVNHYSSIDELLEAGFDSYYGSFSDFTSVKTKKDFDKKIETNLKILKKHKDKSIISALATHDQKAPVLRSENYWNMVLWLSTTLPLNSYFLDGFSVGDDFTYDYENQKALISYTDDEYYYVHSGLFDIFNYTAPIRSKHPNFKRNYIKAIAFKKANLDLFKKENYKTLKTTNEKVFSYSLESKNKKLIVIGSLDENEKQKALISADLKKGYSLSIINSKTKPMVIKNKLETTLEPLEIQVYMINH